MLERKTQEAEQLQALREMTTQAVAACQDGDLLDLVYKLLATSGKGARA